MYISVRAAVGAREGDELGALGEVEGAALGDGVMGAAVGLGVGGDTVVGETDSAVLGGAVVGAALGLALGRAAVGEADSVPAYIFDHSPAT